MHSEVTADDGIASIGDFVMYTDGAERRGLAALSPRVGKKITLPESSFMSRQKTTGGEVRRAKGPRV